MTSSSVVAPLLLSLASLSLLGAGCGGDSGDQTASGAPDTGTQQEDAAREDARADATPSETPPDAPALDAETGPDWPSCDSKPTTATTSTIPALWATNPASPAFTWVSGAVVTAVSFGGCAADKACQIFLQEPSPATTLAGVAKKAIKVFVSAKAGARFTAIAPGDQVDVAGHAWRYNIAGQNELLLQVNDALRGCIKKTGTGTITAVPATLTDLGSVAAYETQYGPVLVTVSGVSGNTDASLSATFGLWPTTGGFDAGASAVVSLSPYCLPGGAFAGLGASKRYDFLSVTGVFGLYSPSAAADAGTPAKYLEIYARTMADLAPK